MCRGVAQRPSFSLVVSLKDEDSGVTLSKPSAGSQKVVVVATPTTITSNSDARTRTTDTCVLRSVDPDPQGSSLRKSSGGNHHWDKDGVDDLL